MSRINLITTCTNGKYGKTSNALNLGDYSAGKVSSELLIQSWCNAIKTTILHSDPINVENLYKGGHWTTAKAIQNEYCADLWVLSAGLGLLHSKDRVVPYQATFATGYKESIPLYSRIYSGKAFHRTWWKAMTEYSFFKEEHPTSIAALMHARPKEYFIICGSPDYINAIEIDIFDGLRHLKNPFAQVLIITSKEIDPRLSPYLLKSDARIAQWLKCNMLMLNISLAKYVVGEFRNYPFKEFNKLSYELSQQFKLLPARNVVKGKKRTPVEVERFISDLLRQQPKISPTQALRSFRDSGNSFEEKRFRNLFQTVASNNG